ncbi:MAG TPA: phosphoribosylformylglycinamidine cyclo-ligase [Candidatus Dormibacteraeota bacterium]|nr:phosphoribosylformylglycinamidine cyclo-ligase [Candidatus Dormibacteraeota bacterium]
MADEALPGGDGLSYAAAGVDVAAYARMLERVRGLIAATQGAEVVTGVGPFAGLYRLPSGELLAASADGVGTKIKVAIACGRHRGIGHDLVNHCVNDIATAGARPLFLMDYFAGGRLEETVFAEVMTGLVEACSAVGCALLGGETAEMPGVYALGDYDLAGFVVGRVEAGREREPVRPGDLLVGLPSSGLHTNGFSLVRRVFEGVSLDRVEPGLGRPLGEELLEPHRCYLRQLQSLPWKAAAHITGGGLLVNLPRALPEDLAAEVDRSSWEVPPIFELIARRGRISDEEMLGTFNMGLGMVLVTSEPLPDLPVVGRVVRRSGAHRVTFR